MITKYLLIITIWITSFTGECYAVLGTNQIESHINVPDYVSPTARFKQHHSMRNITAVLNKYGATDVNKKMFEGMIQKESAGFIGYHAASNDFRIFQDIIRVAIEEYLGIPVRADFQFLRVPGSPELFFDSVEEFYVEHPKYDDQTDQIQAHLLSLNIALYYSWNFEYDFTPRYFLQNASSKKPIFEEKLVPFFERFGMGREEIDEIFKLARQFVPRNKGVILQLFDRSHENSESSAPYSFANVHAFEANRYGKAIETKKLSSYYLFPKDNLRSKTNKYWLPKLGRYGTNNPNSIRLLLSNKHSLNPNSPLVILRHHNMDSTKEFEYETHLREYMRTLNVDRQQADEYQEHLIKLWY